MSKINFYELLYQYRMDDEYAGRLMENELRDFLEQWCWERMRATLGVSPMYFQDLYQEAVVGMYEAMETFREDKCSSFVTYLKIIVENRLKNYTRELVKKSDVPLNRRVSMDSVWNINGFQTIHPSFIAEKSLNDPMYVLQMRESREHLMQAINELIQAERDVLFAWQEDNSYKEGSEKLGMSLKEYEGKLLRTRKKLKSKVVGKS